MKRLFNYILASVLLLIIGSYVAESQALYFYKIFDDKFSTMRIQWIGRSGMGDTLEIPWNQFQLTENGVSKTSTITMDCSAKPIPETSVLFLIDVSVSMNDEIDEMKHETKLDWVKYAVNAFIDSLNFTGDTKMALVFFTNGTKWSESSIPCEGFKGEADTATMRRALEKVKIGLGKTDYELAFFGPTIKPFIELQGRNEDIQRHLIFMTDSSPDVVFNTKLQDSIANLAKISKTFVHVAAVWDPPHDGLKYVAARTGGVHFEAKNKEYLKKQLLSLVSKVQRKWFCELNWKSDFTCDESGRSREIDIKRLSMAGLEDLHKDNYTAPVVSVNDMTTPDDEFYFGEIGSAQAENKIKITHKGGEYTFQGLKFEPFGDYKVKNWGGSAPPFQFKNNETREITIMYNDVPVPTTSKKTVVTPQIKDYTCPVPTFELVSLCSGSAIGAQNFTEVMVATDSIINLSCAFKNKTGVPVEVKYQFTGPDASDFSFVGGGNSKILDPASCLELQVKFRPSKVGAKTASITYTLPEGCPTGYKTDLSGTGTPNVSVEEDYLGAASGSLKISAEPNPATSGVNLYFTVTKADYAIIELYDAMGNRIEELFNGKLNPGDYQSSYNVSQLNNGVYFMRIQAGNESYTHKMIVNK